MPSSTTELIKSKLDIVDFLRGYLTLTPAGKNFKALCPFHHEKSPSFMISPDRQSWHCFGCSLGGDIFTFAMKYENLEFGEALRMLAEKAGVSLREQNPAEYRFTGLLYDLNNQAKEYFKRALAAAPIAKKYLAERGLSASIIEEFELGWAPNESEGLSMFLLNSGTVPQDLLQAGLAIKTDRGLMLDRFRGRIMFPIHNHLGKVVGFTGRILPQLETPASATGFVNAKYVNSPETPIFQKSKLLYGFWRSRDAIREAKVAVLVEGQMDFLMSYQSGVKNVVASSGTALTADHLHSIHRLAEELVLSFDSDVAGSDAAERGIDLAEANDFSVKIAVFKDFKDAAEAAKADPANVQKCIAAAVPAPEFYFTKYLPKDMAELTARTGLHNLRVILAKLKHIASPVEREHWFKELAKRTGINEATLNAESEKANQAGIPASAHKEKEEPVVKRVVSRQEKLAEELFSAGYAAGNFEMLAESEKYLNPLQREILALLKSGKKKSDDPTLDAALEVIVLRASSDPSEEEIAFLKKELEREFVKERRHILTLAIKNAEAKGDQKEVDVATAELSALPSVSRE